MYLFLNIYQPIDVVADISCIPSIYVFYILCSAMTFKCDLKMSREQHPDVFIPPALDRTRRQN